MTCHLCKNEVSKKELVQGMGCNECKEGWA